MTCFSIIVTIKNRKDHFLKIFSSLITQQQPQDYELIFVDYASQDNFEKTLKEQIKFYSPLFSDSLKKIKRVYLEEDFKFNSGKAKNLGSKFADSEWLSFSDADVFLSMDYHFQLLQTLELSKNCFFSSRFQETTEHLSRRISPKTNYGNMIVKKDHFTKVGGFDENNPSWGGDDDDIIHRLKLSSLFELNPRNLYESYHTSILHCDDLRVSLLESTEKSSEISKQKFEKIYNRTSYLNSNYLNFYENHKGKIKVEKEYEAP